MPLFWCNWRNRCNMLCFQRLMRHTDVTPRYVRCNKGDPRTVTPGRYRCNGSVTKSIIIISGVTPVTPVTPVFKHAPLSNLKENAHPACTPPKANGDNTLTAGATGVAG